MLTKWGAALGLASAGRVVAGGSGALGDATVWGPVLDWTALGTIPGPLRVGDFAPVNDLQPGSGLAIYDGTDWRLYQAVFPTVADLLAFGELIASGAIATVGTGIETDPAYYYDTATLQWLRMPDGVHYIWQQRADWTALGTIPAPQNNDRVAVQDLGTAHSSGVAERHGGTWKLVQGRFASVADMVAFPESVHAGAFAEVKSGGGHDDDSVTYVYQSGSWVRFAALTSGFAWALSSLDDFSAVGLQDGDYGVFTPSGGGPILVRYVAACAYRAGTGTGTRQIWVHPDIYGRANLQIEAYVVGTEAPPAYGSSLQGYQYDRTGAATITGNVSGYMRLDAPAPGAGSQFAFLTAPAISGAKRFYIRTEVRGTTAGTVGQSGLFNLSAIPQSQWAVASQRNVSTAAFLPILWNQVGGTWDAALTGTAVRNGGNALPASTPWIVEGLSSGGAITDMMETRIDGLSYCSLRRNFDSATVSTNFNVVPLASGNVSGTSSGRLEIRNHYVLSSD